MQRPLSKSTRWSKRGTKCTLENSFSYEISESSSLQARIWFRWFCVSTSLTRSTASIPPTNLTTNLSWWHLSTLRQYLQPVGSESIHHTAGKARYGPTNSAVGGSTNLLRKSAWERANCRACTGMGFGRIWNLVPKRMASLRPSRTDRDVLLLGPNSRSIIAPLLQLFQRRVLSNSCLLTLAWWVSFVSG